MIQPRRVQPISRQLALPARFLDEIGIEPGAEVWLELLPDPGAIVIWPMDSVTVTTPSLDLRAPENEA
jgi:hypothetical protein